MMEHSHGPENPNTDRGYEVEDASVREVALTGVWLAVGTIIVCVAIVGLIRVLSSAEVRGREPVNEMTVPSAFPPGPRLQERPWEEMEALRRHEDQVLTTYGWADRDTGKVRIPIDRAMDIVVQRGLPVRPGGADAGAQGAAPISPASPGTTGATSRGTQGEGTNAPRR